MNEVATATARVRAFAWDYLVVLEDTAVVARDRQAARSAGVTEERVPA